ncbi:MAG: four helix bundle protein [Actinomycetia bacterium]|nr:four helix bundle protein [Actinomycetes bacterium]
MLDFQQLRVYNRALDLVALATDVIEAMGPGLSHIAVQLDKASTSVAVNIAEGAGEFSPKEKGRFYRIARRSATETVAWFDVLRRKRRISDEHHATGTALGTDCIKALTTLAKRFSP